MNLRVAVLLFALGMVGVAVPTTALGQPTREGTVVAEFDDARAISVDPLGRLYVAEAGRDAVVVVGSDGERLQVIGGSGTRAGEFDTPSDVDPTNGQVIVVADTYNGRVQRFTEDGQYLESLPIGGSGAGLDSDWAFDDGRDGSAVRGDGRPISVATDDSGALYILDEQSASVFRWTDLGGVERIIGGSGGAARLASPVSIGVGTDGEVYVADAGRGKVLVYDRFGTYTRALPTPDLDEVRSVTVRRETVWIVCAGRVLTWDLRAHSLGERSFGAEPSFVDIAIYGTGVYILTSSRLIRYMIG